jgi:hypothetical protein
MALGWGTVILAAAVAEFSERGKAYHVTSRWVNALQFMSILESAHAALHLVNSGVVANCLQWAARSHVLYHVVASEPGLHKSWAVSLMFFAWGAGEVCRYPWCDFLTRVLEVFSSTAVNMKVAVIYAAWNDSGSTMTQIENNACNHTCRMWHEVEAQSVKKCDLGKETLLAILVCCTRG